MYCAKCGKQLAEDDAFCSRCGTPQASTAAEGRKPQMLVKNYKSRAQMDRDAREAAENGWRMVGQSGQFDSRPWLTRPMFFAKKVTVTWARD